ncbi:MAG: cytochrome ubiquinol oxidase subunit I [Proteobacteria bacterium]|nr:cytochrome ubiquinol oxidase subunit I [Pseudomonadota bacterium]
MDNLLAARTQMALSLGFHIVFASIGIAMPFLMALAHLRYLRGGDPVDRDLTKAWSKGVAIFFAIGAVSGTVLSFELGLLWPRFMDHAGAIIGMPFSWEGTAFFLEAIALGIFLYGWERVPRWIHWGSGVVVGVSGVASGVFVVCANAWMNSPAGFDWNGGQPTAIDPWKAMFNPAAATEGLHMIVAAFEAVGFAVAGVHAWLLLKTRLDLHRRAFRLALIVASGAAILQPLVGDVSAKSVARRQPIKLAAMEGHFQTERGASLIVGGWPDAEAMQTRMAIRIPRLLSFLAFGDLDHEVKGLADFPRDQWPPIAPTHVAFQVMVGLGSLLAVLGLFGLAALRFAPDWLDRPQVLRLFAWSTPLGFLALEAGWVVTEVGRQPWIIYGLLRTVDALTPRPGVVYTLGLYAVTYALLAVIAVALLGRQIRLLDRQQGGART